MKVSTSTLEAVKTRLSITGPSLDATITALIQDVAEYCISAGIPEAVLETPTAYGLLAMGVNDIWGAGAGTGQYSSLFNERVIQLANITAKQN